MVRVHFFLIRFAAALFVVLLVTLGGYIGVGWVFWAHPQWASRFVGMERASRFHMTYAWAMGMLNQHDANGNGIADGYEFFLHRDPRNPASQLPVEVAPEDSGIVAKQHLLNNSSILSNRFSGRDTSSDPQDIIEPGERHPVHARLLVFSRPAVFVRGAQVRLSVGAPGRIALPGGVFSNTPLLVPVDAAGGFQFEVTVPAEAIAGDALLRISVHVTNAASTAYAGQASFTVARKRPPVPCAVESVPESDILWLGAIASTKRTQMVRLRWTPDASASGQIVETTRDPTGKVWFPIGLCEWDRDMAVFTFELDDSNPRYQGPIRFRVVPMVLPHAQP